MELLRLVKHTSFKRLDWRKGWLTPNPYTTTATIEREELSDAKPWTGYEARPGWADIRLEALQRDDFTCFSCKTKVTYSNAQVDHLDPYRNFKRPVDANRLGNLVTLCEECHKRKTQRDRRMESRVQ